MVQSRHTAEYYFQIINIYSISIENTSIFRFCLLHPFFLAHTNFHKTVNYNSLIEKPLCTKNTYNTHSIRSFRIYNIHTYVHINMYYSAHIFHKYRSLSIKLTIHFFWTDAISIISTTISFYVKLNL